MTKDLAIAHLLANFAYIDNEIAYIEIKKLKEISEKLKLKVNIDDIVRDVVDKADTLEMDLYAEALAYINTRCELDEKLKILKYAVELIEADGKIMDKEVMKIKMVSANWNIDIKEVFSYFIS